MPALDWQFLIVTMLAAGAGGVIVRRLMPARKVEAKGADAPAMPAAAACAHCALAEPASAAKRPAPTRTATVPVVSVRDLRDSAHQRRST